jgi:hypothetical protein
MDARVHDQRGLSSREKMRWKTENGSGVRASPIKKIEPIRRTLHLDQGLVNLERRLSVNLGRPRIESKIKEVLSSRESQHQANLARRKGKGTNKRCLLTRGNMRDPIYCTPYRTCGDVTLPWNALSLGIHMMTLGGNAHYG